MQHYGKILKIIGPNLKKSFADKILSFLDEKEGIILDIGCGGGGDAYYISSKTKYTVIGVDKNQHAINYAANYVPVVKADIEETVLPLTDEVANYVYCANLLQLLTNIPKAFAEIYRLLKSRGKIFILVTPRDQIKGRYINDFFPTLKSIELERNLSIYSTKKLLQDCGFKNITVHTIEMEDYVINEEYIKRLKSGIFSSILELDELEREKGFAALSSEFQYNKATHKEIRLPRIKKIIAAMK